MSPHGDYLEWTGDFSPNSVGDRMTRSLTLLALVGLSAAQMNAGDSFTGGVVVNLIASQPQNLGDYLDQKVGGGLGSYLWYQKEGSRFALKPRLDAMVFAARSVPGGARRASLVSLGADFPIFFSRSNHGLYFNNGVALTRWTVKGPAGTLDSFGLSQPSTSTAKWSGSLGLGFRGKGWLGEVNLITSSVTPKLKTNLVQLTAGFEF